MRELLRRVVALIRRRQVVTDLDEEIAGHVSELEREYEDAGLSPDEARRRARLRLGGALQTRESSTDAWRFGWLETWLRDLGLGARALRRQPVFSLAAIGTFALGIGAATAIFSVAYGIAFRPLPYPGADRIVRIYESNTKTNEPKAQVSQGTFQAWRESVSSLEHVALFGPARVNYTPGDASRPVIIRGVSPAFFAVLGAAPVVGRTFNPESEYSRGTTNELVLSYDGWQRLFGGDVSALSRPFHLNERGLPMQIVGVMPPGFAFDAPVDAWRPDIVELPIASVIRSWRYDRAVARVKADRTIEDLRAELDLASARLARDFPATNAGWTTTVEPLRNAIIGRFSGVSGLLLAAVAGLLLVACANVAGLLTARALGRRRETSIRIALGAGRWRLAQLWVAEALVLAATGAAIGVGLAWWLVRLLRAAAPAGLPRVEDIAIDLPALGVACGATVVSAIGCALVPLWTSRDRRLPDGLRAGTHRSGDSPTRRRVSAALVALQSGTALALVVTSVVFARSFVRLTSVDLGWRPPRVLSLHVGPRWPAENRRPWFLYAQWADQLVARLEATPGVARAAITTTLPFSPETYPAEVSRGRDRGASQSRWPITLHSVTPGYFDALGLTLRRGRLITTDDRFDEPTLTARVNMGRGVAVVSESVARALWPGEDPIGQVFRVPNNDGATYREVVGVVADVQFANVGQDPTLHVFLPWAQNPTGAPRLVVRATEDAAAISASVQAAVRAEYASTVIDRVTIVDSLVRQATAPARITSQLIAALGGLALVLAVVGVYGALSTLVQARAREIAVRAALGASPAQTMWRTLGAGLSPVAVGTVAGLALAVSLVSSARSLLFEVERVDAGSLVTGALVVLVCTTIACVAPAIRAARTDPLTVLRGD